MRRRALLAIILTCSSCLPAILTAANTGSADPEAISYLRTHGTSPEAYVLGKFQRYDVVLLAEDHAVHQNLELARNLIPLLYRAGIRNFGMEFGATEDQAKLDALVTADHYDAAEARRLMFDYNVRWAYRGYLNIYRAVWSLNHALPPGAPRFRILNLSYRYDWAGFNGVLTPSNVCAVFPKGDTERFRAALINREILAQHKKILILTGTIHAFTRYKQPDYDYLSTGYCRLETRYMGERLYRMAPARVCTIILHQPFPGPSGGLVSPAFGAVETIMVRLGDRPVGFDLPGTPLGDLADGSGYAAGHPNFRLGDLADGYIFLAPFKAQRGCALDRKFLTAGNWSKAQRDWPDPNWTARPASPADYWRTVGDFVDLAKRYRQVAGAATTTSLVADRWSGGRLERYPDFQSRYVRSREVDIWLPPGYQAHPDRGYPVIYMQDGQNLFDPRNSFGGVTWGVDRAIVRLIRSGETKGAIIVGIWNTGIHRAADYVPEKAVAVRDISKVPGLVACPSEPIDSDAYLKFMVEELKPFVDRTFRTRTDPAHTFAMGSSLGALISAYAVAQYPDVFGAAACLSTHWPAANGAVVGYLSSHLPKADGHRLYFDFGSATLDAAYGPYQAQMDQGLRDLGYREGYDWVTRNFPGADHSEASWSKRVDIPLRFLLEGSAR